MSCVKVELFYSYKLKCNAKAMLLNLAKNDQEDYWWDRIEKHFKVEIAEAEEHDGLCETWVLGPIMHLKNNEN